MTSLLLADCRAHLVAPTETQTASLRSIAAKVGFGDICSVLSRKDRVPSGDRKVGFFLVHRHLQPGMMQSVLRSVRNCADDQVRFSPVVLFTDDGPFEDYLGYIHMGFDDVITLPEKQPILVQRLASQVGKLQIYFETQDYFGPDRRRLEVPGYADNRRSAERHSHARYIFRREPLTGVAVMRTEIYEPLVRAAS